MIGIQSNDGRHYGLNKLWWTIVGMPKESWLVCIPRVEITGPSEKSHTRERALALVPPLLT